MSSPVAFFERPYPSANAVLLNGPRPVLVDPGFGADVPALLSWLRTLSILPQHLAMVINTHFDCDHAGGNSVLAESFGLQIATGASEAAMVNRRHPETGRAQWLRQPLEPYRVAMPLTDGETIDTGAWRWSVIGTPGHTSGHISLFCSDARVLVAGDAVHANDVGWIDFRRPGALEEAGMTIDRLASLGAGIAYSGHGSAFEDVTDALARARRRLVKWRDAPDAMGWHAVKRIFAYALMVENGIPDHEVSSYLTTCPWVDDYAGRVFDLSPSGFADALLAEMLRSGAARWKDGRLVAGTAFVPPRAQWAAGPTRVSAWPP